MHVRAALDGPARVAPYARRHQGSDHDGRHLLRRAGGQPRLRHRQRRSCARRACWRRSTRPRPRPHPPPGRDRGPAPAGRQLRPPAAAAARGAARGHRQLPAGVACHRARAGFGQHQPHAVRPCLRRRAAGVRTAGRSVRPASGAAAAAWRSTSSRRSAARSPPASACWEPGASRREWRWPPSWCARAPPCGTCIRRTRVRTSWRADSAGWARWHWCRRCWARRSCRPSAGARCCWRWRCTRRRCWRCAGGASTRPGRRASTAPRCCRAARAEVFASAAFRAWASLAATDLWRPLRLPAALADGLHRLPGPVARAVRLDPGGGIADLHPGHHRVPTLLRRWGALHSVQVASLLSLGGASMQALGCWLAPGSVMPLLAGHVLYAFGHGIHQPCGQAGSVGELHIWRAARCRGRASA